MVFDFPASAPVSLALGVHVVTLAVTDNGGETVGDTLLITVVQDTPPVVDPGHGFTVVATSPAGAQVSIYGSVSDQDGDSLTATWSGPFGSQSIDLNPAIRRIECAAYGPITDRHKHPPAVGERSRRSCRQQKRHHRRVRHQYGRRR